MNESEVNVIVGIAKWTVIGMIGITLTIGGCQAVHTFSEAAVKKAAMENGYAQKRSGFGPPIWIKPDQETQ